MHNWCWNSLNKILNYFKIYKKICVIGNLLIKNIKNSKFKILNKKKIIKIKILENKLLVKCFINFRILQNFQKKKCVSGNY